MEKNYSFKKNTLQFKKAILVFTVFISTVFFSGNLFAQITATPDSGCSPLSIDYSTNLTGPYVWDLGNSNTSTQQNPSANYPQPGTYTVSLTANGGTPIEKTIEVYPLANPIFPTTVACAPFSGTITVDPGIVTVADFDIDGTPVGGITGANITSYTFNFFGDLPTVTQASEVLDFSSNPVPAGTYNLLLTTLDNNGCSTSTYIPSASRRPSKMIMPFWYMPVPCRRLSSSSPYPTATQPPLPRLLCKSNSALEWHIH